jgi:hypothetical protein
MGRPEVPDDDELADLPPLDGDSRDPPDGDGENDDLLDGADQDATLDDATGEDDPVDTSDLDLDKVEGGWLGEAGEAEDLDMGDVAVIDFGDDTSRPYDPASAQAEGNRELDDEARLADEDLGLVDAPERGGLDAGDEGPLDADEELREADLPALDADDEGELEDSALIDPAFASEEPLGLHWAAEPWARVGAPVALGTATAVACSGRGVLVVGRSDSGAPELVRVDLEGTCERLAAEGLDVAEVCALAADKQIVAAVLSGGRLLISCDSGVRFEPVAGPIGEGVSASDVVFASGRLWVRTRTGGLMVQNAPDGESPEKQPIERCPVPGIAAALTCDTANNPRVAAALVVDDTARPTAVIRIAAAGSIRVDAVDMPEADSPARFAAHGGRVAYAARGGGLVWCMSGVAWKLFEWEGRVTALAFVDDAGTLVASTYSDADDTTTLVRIDVAGSATVAARIGAAQADADSDGRVRAIAHDEARGVLWVAGGFGVAAFAIR